MRSAAHVSFWLSLLIMNRDSYQVRFITTQWRQLSSSTEENFLTEPSNDKSWFPFVLFQSCLYFHLVHLARAAAVGQTQTPSYFLNFHFCIYKSQRAHSTYRVAQEDWWVCKVLLSDAQKMSSTMHSGFFDTIFGFALKHQTFHASNAKLIFFRSQLIFWHQNWSKMKKSVLMPKHQLALEKYMFSAKQKIGKTSTVPSLTWVKLHIYGILLTWSYWTFQSILLTILASILWPAWHSSLGAY